MSNLKNKSEKGITLIALVVTIVVLIILATISLNVVIQGGIIQKAKDAKDYHYNAQAEEHTKLEEMANGIAKYYTDSNSNSDEKITVTVDGKTETITRDNVAYYLGKVVTNYKPTASTVTVGANTYTVSTQYRLYYVDFDKKYGNEVSIFLKADCTNNFYALGEDATSADANNIKIKALNPALYKAGVTAPSASNDNMKAVTWLLNTNNWNSLKTGASLADKVNYVVGAPSVEMMMDSYNTKYELTNLPMNTGKLTADTNRVKLFYRYNNDGYEVGPCNNEPDFIQEYGGFTSGYSVKTDPKIDTVYYPGDEQGNWLASPCGVGVMTVAGADESEGGCVASTIPDSTCALCPLVSLQSSATLELQ